MTKRRHSGERQNGAKDRRYLCLHTSLLHPTLNAIFFTFLCTLNAIPHPHTSLQLDEPDSQTISHKKGALRNIVAPLRRFFIPHSLPPSSHSFAHSMPSSSPHSFATHEFMNQIAKRSHTSGYRHSRCLRIGSVPLGITTSVGENSCYFSSTLILELRLLMHILMYTLSGGMQFSVIRKYISVVRECIMMLSSFLTTSKNLFYNLFLRKY